MQSPVTTTRRSLVAGLAVTAALLASLLPFASVYAAVPTVSSVNWVETTPTNASTLHWTVTFSEAVAGVDTSDFALAETGTATGSIASVSSGTTTYTVTVDTVAGDGSLGLNVLAGGITSVSTSQALATPFAGQVYTIDHTVLAPSTPDLDPASDTGTSNTDNITSDTTPTFNGTAEANASVQLFDGGSTLIASGTANALGNWSLTSTTLSAGAHSITAKQTDTAGNGPSAASGALAITIDTNVPTAPSTPDLQAGSDSGTSTADNITNDTTPTFQGTGPISTRIDLYAGTVNVGTATSDVSGNWQITSAGLVGGSYVFTAKATNLAGSSPSSPGLAVTIETSLTVTISLATSQADVTNHLPINFSVVFSNPVTDFVATDVAAGGTAPGTRSVFVTGSGTTYNVAVTGPTNTGTVTISFAAGAAHDAAGNASEAPFISGNTVTYDITPGPTVTINQASSQGDPTALTPINFTITFSEAVTGFVPADVVIGGTAAGTKAVTLTALNSVSYNAAVTGMTSSGTVTATVPADAATGNVNQHPTQASTSIDNTVTYILPAKWIVTPSTLSPTPGSTITVNAQLADANGNAAPGSGTAVTWTSTNGGVFSAADERDERCRDRNHQLHGEHGRRDDPQRDRHRQQRHRDEREHRRHEQPGGDQGQLVIAGHHLSAVRDADRPVRHERREQGRRPPAPESCRLDMGDDREPHDECLRNRVDGVRAAVQHAVPSLVCWCN